MRINSHRQKLEAYRLRHIEKACKARRDSGALQYGDDSFVEKNILEELRAELYDQRNYIDFILYKLMLIEKGFKVNTL